MNPSQPGSQSTIVEPGVSWWLDPGLAKLAFGSRPDRRQGNASTGVASHLAFLPPESLEIDLADPQQRTFGDYELIELIGQGGMGVVYRARQHSLDREVAVKLLSAGPWASVDFIARFQREAQSAARMQHPNIVPIHEIGAHEELNFFSMRLVKGGSLANLLAEKGKLPPREAVRILRAVAEAVDYAHRLDVLHLDLKPGNVLLDEMVEPQVADFGLAKRLDETLAADSSEVSGTPSYMAPEQAQANAQKLTPATDIYGLGTILYECLTGRPPFASTTAQETLRLVVTEAPVELRKIDPTIPVDLEAICLKCLAKDPSERYRTARALSDDLSRFVEGREVRARPLDAGQRFMLLARREPRLTGLGALLFFSLVLGFAASWVQWKRAESNADSARSLLWEGRREAALRLEQDGKGFEALPKLLANIADQQRAGRTDAVAMERQRLGVLVGQGAQLIDRFVIADANPLSVAVSPNGELLAVALNDQSVRWYDTRSLKERGRVSLAGRDSSEGERRPVLLLRFLDGARLLATLEWYANQVSPSDSYSWLIELDPGRLVEPPPAFADFADATYSQNGRFAVLRNQQKQSQAWSVNPWKPISAMSRSAEESLPWFVDPRGRYALFLSTSMRRINILTLPDMTAAHTIDLPGNAGISALAVSSDGDQLALGDFEGRVFILDVAGPSVRALPSPRGRQISWVAFSEDNAWLATASSDGAVHAFDVATGDSLTSGELGQDFTVQRVGISRDRRLLIAAGEGRVAVWRLPFPGPQAAAATRLGLSPAPHGLTGRYPIGWSFSTGLLATSGIDGQVRLWRLPADPMLPALAAPQIPERTFFDGAHVVDVAWNKLRVISAQGRALTGWLELPQPPGFAEMLDSGKSIVVTVGAQLRVYDSKSLRPTIRPLALVSSPERLLATADGSRIVLCFGQQGPEGFQEHLQVFDGQSGKRLPGEAVLDGGLRQLAFSPDGTRLVAVGSAETATTVLSTEGLRMIRSYPHDPYEPVIWADFSSATGDLLLVTRAADSRLGEDSLIRWNPDSDRATNHELPSLTRPLGVLATSAGAFVAGEGQDALFVDSVDLVVSSRLARSPPLAVTALSPDRHLLARAFRREVQLLDAVTGAPLGPPLQSDSDAVDVIAQLVFSPDGGALLARTLQGHWLLWTIKADLPTRHLEAELPALALDRESQSLVRMPSQAARNAMRQDDPGPWTPSIERPRPPAAPAATHQEFIPRQQGADVALVDLSSIYNSGPDSVRSTFYNIRPIMRPLPFGVQRFAGQDFDMRGLAQLTNTSQDQIDFSVQVTCLPLPPIRFAALHPLMTVSARSPLPSNRIVARFVLNYLDGTSAGVDLRAGREVRGYAGDDSEVNVAFAGDRALALFGMQDDVLVSPRLVNPFPGKLPRCLGIDSMRSSVPMLLVALTMERP